MKNVWIVEGSTGEFSDYEEWTVVAYGDEQSAKEHAAFLNAKLVELGLKERRRSAEVVFRERQKVVAKMRQFDPNVESQYTGTDYTYWRVPFRETFEEPTK